MRWGLRSPATEGGIAKAYSEYLGDDLASIQYVLRLSIACLLLLSINSSVFAEAGHSASDYSKQVCRKGRNSAPNSRTTSRCSQQPTSAIPKQHRHDSDEMLRTLPGTGGHAVADEGAIAGLAIGPCVAVATQPRPHIDTVVQPQRTHIVNLEGPIVILKNAPGLSKRLIVRAYKMKRGLLARCLRTARVDPSKRGGHIRLRVSVLERGVVRVARRSRGADGHDTLVGCITQVMEHMRFPQPKSGRVEFLLPLSVRVFQ